MTLWTRTINQTPYLYWKIGTSQLSLGKKHEVLALLKLANKSAKHLSIVREVVSIQERKGLEYFLKQSFKDIKKEVKTLG